MRVLTIALAVAQTSALVAPLRAASRVSAVFAAPPELAYAADKPAEAEYTDASFVGQYELEEREDADDAKTLMELSKDGKIKVGATDGIPYVEAVGRWEYDGKELILELTRSYEDAKAAFATTRVFIGDVIALNDVPPQVQGAIKMTPSPTSDDMLRIPRHTLPTDAVGYFVAVKIPAVPGAL